MFCQLDTKKGMRALYFLMDLDIFSQDPTAYGGGVPKIFKFFFFSQGPQTHSLAC